MRLAIFLLALTLTISKDPTILTGVVSIDNDPINGCKVEVLENGVSQTTDSEGRFRVTVNDLDKMTLKLSYLDRLTCKVEIKDIKMERMEVDLGTVPLFFNETISVADYEKLNAEKRKTYDEIRHWTQLIGYINKNLVDTSAVRINLWDKRKIKYRIDCVDNKIIIDYKDWNK
jgi:hypothetical protein